MTAPTPDNTMDKAKDSCSTELASDCCDTEKGKKAEGESCSTTKEGVKTDDACSTEKSDNKCC